MNNSNINYKRALPSPEELKKEIPISKEIEEIKLKRDQEIDDVFRGKSDKLLLIIGPCSADRMDSVLEYIKRLVPIQEQVKDKIIIIPRIYTGKPRTIGAGYKGMIHQPNPEKDPDMIEGIRAVREIHKRAIEETGLSPADEMLYPENYAYLSDLLSYVAVGARSVENQGHRLVSSGINIPVGMKNPISGDLNGVLNSVKAAQTGQVFIYRGWEVESSGNDLAHVVLRGSTDRHGINHANYHYEDLRKLYDLYCNENYLNPAVIIDINHCLLGYPDSSNDSQKVYSHAQAIGQCKKYIYNNLKSHEIIEVESTAKGAEIVHETKQGLCISNKTCAELYGLKVIDENIQDRNNNQTRFFVLSKNKEHRKENVKASIVFSTQNKPGALYQILGLLNTFEINMTKIESRPSEKKLGDYWFWIDTTIDELNKKTDVFFEILSNQCSYFRILGIY